MLLSISRMAGVDVDSSPASSFVGGDTYQQRESRLPTRRKAPQPHRRDIDCESHGFSRHDALTGTTASDTKVEEKETAQL